MGKGKLIGTGIKAALPVVAKVAPKAAAGLGKVAAVANPIGIAVGIATTVIPLGIDIAKKVKKK